MLNMGQLPIRPSPKATTLLLWYGFQTAAGIVSSISLEYLDGLALPGQCRRLSSLCLVARDSAAACVMPQKLNARFFIYSSTVLVVLAVATHALHTYQVRRTARTLLQIAIHAEQGGDLERSAFFLRHYLNYAG